MAELHELGLVEAADAIRCGEVRAEALVEALIGRAEQHADLNCFIDFDVEGARAAARQADRQRKVGERLGALHGVPMTFKDSINVAGMRTTAGSAALRAHRPARSAPVVDRLVRAGAIPLGKNGMHEFSFGITSNNATFGPPRNPFDPLMIPGGSSGGTAASIAARLTPAGIGTDTGGSVRIPASLCGVWGFRPTTKRWPQAGIVPISYTRDTPGPLARHIDDLVVLDALVVGETKPLLPAAIETLRLGVPRAHFWEELDTEVREQCEAALATLRNAEVTLVEVDISDLIPIDALSSFVVTLYEIHSAMATYLEAEGLKISFREIAEASESPDVHELLATTLDPHRAVTRADYQAALNQHRPRLIRAYQDHFDKDRVDAYVFPTCPLPARPIGEDVTVELNGQRVPTFGTFMRNTGPGSNADLPGLTLPVGLTSRGLPIGLALDAAAGRDRELLAVGLALKSLLGQTPDPFAAKR
jgi:mandelamide amidase